MAQSFFCEKTQEKVMARLCECRLIVTSALAQSSLLLFQLVLIVIAILGSCDQSPSMH